MHSRVSRLVSVIGGLSISVSSAVAFGQVPPPPRPGAMVAPIETPEPAPAPTLVETPAPVVAAPDPAPAVTPFASPVAAPKAGVGPLKIDDGNGNSIRFGFLLQPQYQAANSSNPALDKYTQNLYLKRTRILVGGTLFGDLEYFLDTDYPNLFLASNTAAADATPNFAKNTPGMNVQDAFVTYRAIGDMLKVDAGYMLPAMGHNALQGAATLFGWDYYAYSFQHGNRFGSAGNPIGRDAGVQLRGLVLDGHLEYRAGLFQGKRDNQSATEVAARNFFRATARVQVNLLDAEPGYFYAGTYLGKKQILSLGASFDIQDNYKYFAVDGFADLPVGPGVVTAQINLARWDGGTFIPTFNKQTALMGEAGYTLADLNLSPIVRVEKLWTLAGTNDELRLAGGLAYWHHGHNSNLKAFFTHVKNDLATTQAYNQINLQWQVYYY